MQKPEAGVYAVQLRFAVKGREIVYDVVRRQRFQDDPFVMEILHNAPDDLDRFVDGHLYVRMDMHIAYRFPAIPIQFVVPHSASLRKQVLPSHHNITAAVFQDSARRAFLRGRVADQKRTEPVNLRPFSGSLSAHLHRMRFSRCAVLPGRRGVTPSARCPFRGSRRGGPFRWWFWEARPRIPRSAGICTARWCASRGSAVPF